MPLTVVPTVTDATCYNYSDGSIVLGITGGTQPYYFSWANNQEIIFNNPSETLDGLVASNYLVRVHDKNGCSWEQVVTVGQPAPFVTQIASTDALCFGSADGTSDLSVTGGTLPYTYLWSDGSLSEDVTGQLAGVYTVTITDAQGCVVRDTTTIGQPNEILIYGSITDLSCIDQSDASIEVSVQGGVYPYTYNWSTGATSEDIADLIAGNYTLIVTDFQGCTRTETFTISTVNNDCVNPVNTFTPNGDNYNDTWIIENLYLYPNATVEVFNKWGNLVHSQTGVYVPWDGTHLGNALPSDVYYYIIDLYNDQQNKYTGSITIIR
jgi:gliding motility-associated-like protein